MQRPHNMPIRKLTAKKKAPLNGGVFGFYLSGSSKDDV